MGTRLRILFPALLALASALFAMPAFADEQTELEKIRAAYFAKNYDDAESRLRALLDPNGGVTNPSILSGARMYFGAVLVAKHRPSEGAQVFERLLLDDPEYEPDPLSFPADVINLFIDTRARIREKLSAEKARRAQAEVERKKREEAERRRQLERLQTLERLAGEEKIIEHHSRWLALVPFGVGQFQNGNNTLGWALLVTEGAFVAAGTAAVPVYLVQLSNASDSFASNDRVAAQRWLDRANATRIANLSLYGLFAVTAAVGVVEAQLSFVPERVQVRKRPIPTGFHPWIAPVQGRTESQPFSGTIIGVQGSF